MRWPVVIVLSLFLISIITGLIFILVVKKLNLRILTLLILSGLCFFCYPTLSKVYTYSTSDGLTKLEAGLLSEYRNIESNMETNQETSIERLAVWNKKLEMALVEAETFRVWAGEYVPVNISIVEIPESTDGKCILKDFTLTCSQD